MPTLMRSLVVVLLAACGGAPSGPDAAVDVDGGLADAGVELDGAIDASSMLDALPPITERAGQLCAGPAWNCAIRADGSVKCWGRNQYGQLGLGDIASRGDSPGEMGSALPAVDLGSGRTATQLACGGAHACALLDDQTVKCWGFGNYLGLGATTSRGDQPGTMGDNLPAVALGAGLVPVEIATTISATCARFSTGQVKCWGAGSNGQLGNASNATIGDQAGEMGDALAFIDLGTGRTAKALAAGHAAATMCALLDDDRVKCWGRNLVGQLGLGDLDHRGDDAGEMGDALPAVDLGSTPVAQLAAGGLQACVLAPTGSIRCWGQGSNGALGTGSTANVGDGPGEMGASLGVVPLAKPATRVTVGFNVACAHLAGELSCWGVNFAGQLGLGDGLARGDNAGEIAALQPIDLGTSLPVTDVALGDDHVCAMFSDSSVKCWGNGNYGALGTGSLINLGDTAGEMGSALPFIPL